MTPWGAAGSFDIDFSFPVKTSVRLAYAILYPLWNQ